MSLNDSLYRVTYKALRKILLSSDFLHKVKNHSLEFKVEFNYGALTGEEDLIITTEHGKVRLRDRHTLHDGETRLDDLWVYDQVDFPEGASVLIPTIAIARKRRDLFLKILTNKEWVRGLLVETN